MLDIQKRLEKHSPTCKIVHESLSKRRIEVSPYPRTSCFYASDGKTTKKKNSQSGKGYPFC